MEVLIVIGPFLVLGIIVLFVAFAGGGGAAREAYLTGGRRAFPIAILVIYVALGIAVPAAVIAARGEAEGGVGALRTEQPSAQLENGGTGQGRMPAGLLQGEDAEDVAAYVERVAGR